MNFIKKHLHSLFFAGWGLINLILFSITYYKSFYDYGTWGGSYSVGLSGYNVMRSWGFGFGGVMSAFIQIFIFIIGLALLALGVMGFLREFNVAKIPDKLGNFEINKLGTLGLFATAALNVALLIFLFIMCASNTESDWGVSAGLKIGAGGFVALIFSAAAAVGLFMLNKKVGEESAEPAADANAENPPPSQDPQ
jgi:hypothetical protein